jgi:hypothetical protein
LSLYSSVPVICLFLAVSVVKAQDCPEDLGQGPRMVTPADGAAGVSRNALVRIDYTEGYFTEGLGSPETSMELRSAEGDLIDGEFEAVGGRTLFFRPAQLLPEERRFDGVAYGVEGELVFSFRTGRAQDVESPVVGRIVSSSASPLPPGCEAPNGGYRVDLSLEAAVDDGPVGSLRYQVYLSRWGEAGLPNLRTEVRGYAGDRITAAFVLDESEVSTPICVAVQVVDGVGRVSETAATDCFDPKSGQFFAGLCWVAGAAVSSGTPPLAWALGVVLGVLLCRRSGRAGAG